MSRHGKARALGSAEDVQCPQRDSGEPVLLARRRELTEKQPLDTAPEQLRAGDPPGGPWPPVDRLLQLPGGPMERQERRVDRALVWLERSSMPPEQVEDRRRRVLRRDEALVHAVAGDRVDQPRGVADQERSIAGDARTGAAERQAVPA